MKVKIEVPISFTAYADLSGAELEVLMHIAGKLTPVREQCLDGKFWPIADPDLQAKITAEIDPAKGKVLSIAEFETMQAENNERAAKLAAENKAKLAALIWHMIEDENKEPTELLAELNRQSLLHWKEDDNAGNWAIEHDSVTFSTSNNTGRRRTIRISDDGKFEAFPE